MATIYPSGERPQACPAGHSWALGSGLWIVGSYACTCRNALEQNHRRHVLVTCIAPTDHGECRMEYRDPPCLYLQKPEGRPGTGAT